MSKNIIFPYVTFNKFVDEPLIKKLSLFYDKILISESRFSIINEVSQKELKEEHRELYYEKAIWDFLLDNDVVKTYSSFKDGVHTSDEEKELQTFLMNTIKNHHESTKNEKLNKEQIAIQSLNNFYLSHDILTRIDTLKFRKTDELSEYYPSLRNYNTLQSDSKKSQVIQFILNDIPEPDLSTPWEKIIEYRSDDEVKNKYLALVNWVNKVSNSNLKLSEIKDEYDYLHSEYITQFKLHKMKYNNSNLEIILNSTVNFIANISTGNYVSSIKDLFQFNLKNANLLREESKLTGKEIAYIVNTKRTFKK
jgi:hypothetical protein